MNESPPSTSLPDLDISVLENEECWAMRVIDEHQGSEKPSLTTSSESSETSSQSSSQSTREK